MIVCETDIMGIYTADLGFAAGNVSFAKGNDTRHHLSTIYFPLRSRVPPRLNVPLSRSTPSSISAVADAIETSVEISGNFTPPLFSSTAFGMVFCSVKTASLKFFSVVVCKREDDTIDLKSRIDVLNERECSYGRNSDNSRL